MHSPELIFEREPLLGALEAFLCHDKAAYDECVTTLCRDLLHEHRAGAEEKIARWIEVTRIAQARNTRSVQFYVQAKLLYRDGYFEAAIMMCRSAAELICHELLQTVEHPFGDADTIVRENFRRLARFLHKRAGSLSKRHFELLNTVFTTGSSYVHPKGEQSPRRDAVTSLLQLGECIYGLYAATQLPPAQKARRIRTRTKAAGRAVERS